MENGEWKIGHNYTSRLFCQRLWIDYVDCQCPLSGDHEFRRRDLFFKDGGRARQRITADGAVGAERRQDRRREARHLFVLDHGAALGAGQPDVEPVRFADLVQLAHQLIERFRREPGARLQGLYRAAVADDDLQLSDRRVPGDLHRDALDVFAPALGAGQRLKLYLLPGRGVRVVDPQAVELTRAARVARGYVVNQLLELQVFEAAVQDGADRLRGGESRGQWDIERG